MDEKQTITVKIIRVHESFSENDDIATNDMALAILVNPFTLTNTTNIACLPAADLTLLDGIKCANLQSIMSIPVANSSSNTFDALDADDQNPASNLRPGGGLFCNIANDDAVKMAIVGTVETEYMYDGTNKTIYTSIAKYRDWIKRTMGEPGLAYRGLTPIVRLPVKSVRREKPIENDDIGLQCGIPDIQPKLCVKKIDHSLNGTVDITLGLIKSLKSNGRPVLGMFNNLWKMQTKL